MNRDRYRKSTLILGAILLMSCRQGTSPSSSELTGLRLGWGPHFACSDGYLAGYYEGLLQMDGMADGQRVKARYGDSLLEDTVDLGDGRISYGIREYDISRIKDISVAYQGDSLVLSSQDSLNINQYLSESTGLDDYGSFPQSFQLFFGNGRAKTYSFNATDSVGSKVRCSTQNLYTGYVLPDTIRLEPGTVSVSIEIFGDAYRNSYRLELLAVDSNSERVVSRYRVGLGDAVFGKASLRRTRMFLDYALTELPAVIRFPLNNIVGRQMEIRLVAGS